MQSSNGFNRVAGVSERVASMHFVRGSFYRVVVAVAFLVAPTLASAQVEPVVATSPYTLASGLNAYGPSVTDACGDVYVNTGGGVFRYATGTGAVTTVQGGGGNQAIYMDMAKQNLYFADQSNRYSGSFVQVPISNCTPGTLNTGYPGDIGYPFGDYYIQAPTTITGDAYGDVFFTQIAGYSNYTSGAVIFENVNTNGSFAPAIAYAWSQAITQLASDAAGNLYFSDGSNNVYQLKAPYANNTPTKVASGFVSIVSLNLDSQGNLYIVDSNGYSNNPYYNTTPVAILYEIPLESTGLNFDHQYIVANNVGIAAQPGIAIDGTIFYTSYPPGNLENLYALQRDKVTSPATSVGSSVVATVNYVFNIAATPTSVNGVQGTSASSVFTNGGTGNAGGCAGAFLIGQTCTTTLTYNATTPGLQTGGLILATATGTALSTASLSGIGLGPAITIDPGAVNALTTTLKAPSGTAIDSAGNLYVTDTTLNILTEFTAGSGTGMVIPTGALSFKAPQGVAVDSIGNVYVADTGNNRVVEIPVVNGVLTGASAVALSPTLKAPQGVAVDAANDLLIADTGDNNVLFIPSVAGTLDVLSTSSYGQSLNAPSAIALDASGDVFLAEAGNKDVIELAFPLVSGSQAKIISGLTAPTALATDASGSLFLADSGNVYRYPYTAGAFGTRTLVGVTIANPTGLATDPQGNLYVTDMTDDSVTKLIRVNAALSFGLVNINSTSPSQTAMVNDSGNQTATFPSPSYSIAAGATPGFIIDSDGCAGSSVIAGGACAIKAHFSPTSGYALAEEDLDLLGNASGNSPSIALLGSSAVIHNTTLSLVLTSPASGTIIAASPVSFTATVNTLGVAAVPGGFVTFFVNGSQVARVAVTNGSAVLNLTGGLPQGVNIPIVAVYGGDNLNYGGSQATISVTVQPLPSMVSLNVVGPIPAKTTLTPSPSPYTNPISANDVATNAQGPAFTLAATISTGGSTVIAGGTVSFYQGTATSNTFLGMATITPGTTTATITTTALRAGTTNIVENNSYLSNYNIFAVYNGDTTFGTSTSNSVPVIVVAAPACAFTPNPCVPEQTGATFAITPSNPTINIAATTKGPSSGSVALNVTSYGGWQGVLNFTCSGLPQYATCAPYPGDPIVVPSTVAAPEPLTQVLFVVNTNIAPIVATAGVSQWWLGVFFGLVLLLAGRKSHGNGLKQLCNAVAMVMLATASLVGLSGCGSSVATTPYVTPSGTYKVNVVVNAAQYDPTQNNQSVLTRDLPSNFQITVVVK